MYTGRRIMYREKIDVYRENVRCIHREYLMYSGRMFDVYMENI